MMTFDKQACRIDLLKYTKAIFKLKYKTEFVENWHHGLICEELEKVLIGDTTRIIFNMPPRYSKTELCVLSFISWSLGIFPDSEFIHTSYSKRLAASNSSKTKEIVESEVYQSLFPSVKLMDDSKAKDEWKTTAGGVIYAAGSGGTITGYGAGKMRNKFGGAIIIDDPHKPSEVNSEIMRNNVISWYDNTISTRVNSKETPIILIMQRLHASDLTGWLLKGGSGEEWKHVCIPAIIDGKPLWVYKHSKEDLELMRKKKPYVYSGQYMQSPSPLGGGIFKDSWWKYYTVAPNFEYKIITADTAQKTKEYNDYSVFQCWGYYEKAAYLIDNIRGRWEAPDLLTKFRMFYNKHRTSESRTIGKLRNCHIEDKSSGTGLIQTLKKDDKIPIVAIQRNVDKVTRAMDGSPYISSGYVYLPLNAPWLEVYTSEFSMFTPTMAHDFDDQVDATLDAIDILLADNEAELGVW